MSKSHLLMLAAIAAPLVAAAAARVLPFGKAASKAHAELAIMTRPDAEEEVGADEASDSLAFEIPKVADASPATESVHALYRSARKGGFPRTPIAVAPRPQSIGDTAGVQHPRTVDDQLTEALAVAKTFEFTSILTGREAVAMISGRSRKVGDVLKKGWVVVSIDPATSSLVLRHEVAGLQTLVMRQRPGSGEDDPAFTERSERGPANAAPLTPPPPLTAPR